MYVYHVKHWLYVVMDVFPESMMLTTSQAHKQNLYQVELHILFYNRFISYLVCVFFFSVTTKSLPT